MGQANPILGRIEEKIITAESELSFLKTRYTEKHSKVISKKRELQSVRNRQQLLIESSKDLDPTNIEQLWQMANTLPSAKDNESSVLVSQILKLEEAKNAVTQHQQEFDMLDQQVKYSGAKDCW